MVKEIPRYLKLVLITQLIVGFVFGVIYFAIPAQWEAWMGSIVTEVGPYRMMGVCLIMLGVLALMAYTKTDYEQIEVILPAEIVWGLLSFVGMMIWIYVDGGPVAGWVTGSIALAYGVIYLYTYIKNRE